jgi:phage terminase small subunit
MMPSLKRRYEAFCRSYAADPNASAAAMAAGYSDDSSEKQGWRLLQRPEIVARIAELRAERAARDSLSLPALLAKLDTAYRIASESGNAMAVVRIAEMEAKLPALFAKAKAGEGEAQHAESTRAAVARIARQLGVAEPRD